MGREIETTPTLYDAASFAKRVHDTRTWAFQAYAELSAASPGEAVNVVSPFDRFRDTSSRLALTTFGADTPLERGIRSHVLWLLEKRLLFSHDATIADLAKESEGTLRLERSEPISFAAAKHGLLTESHPRRIEAYLAALAEAAPEVSAHVHARREARTEISKQLGIEAHDAPFLPVTPKLVSTAARLFLDRTNELAKFRQRSIKDVSADAGAVVATFIDLTAEAARTGFPAKLNHAWLHDAFPALATARIDPRSGHPSARRWLRRLPEPYFATSFARALYQLGGALGASVEETVSGCMQRSDPAEIHETTVGYAFSGLLLDSVFHRRALGLSSVDARIATRALAQSALVAVRIRAARVRAENDSPRELAEEVFGAELPTNLERVFIHAHDDAKRDFLGVLRGIALGKLLRDTFDEDWFRNPRCSDFFLATEAISMTEEQLQTLVLDAVHDLEELLA